MRKTALRLSLVVTLLLGAAVAQQKTASSAKAATTSSAAPAFDPNRPIVITGAKLLTITQGTIENGVLVIEKGKITAVGAVGSVRAPANGQVLDA